MDPMWLDGELVDRTVAGIDFGSLKYDPDTGQYCLDGVPFTGAAKTRRPDGRLEGVSHLKDGVEHGVSVGWYPDGQIEVYSEMEEGVCHGRHMEWDEGGAKLVDDYYTEGRLIEAAQ
jgi:antitoxin component YwqK of YwqJK toxin-antitoxin module